MVEIVWIKEHNAGGIEPTDLKLSHKSIKLSGLYHEWNIGWQDKLVGKAAWKSDFVRR